MTISEEFKCGYEKGMMDEAESALRNLYIILDQMNETPHSSDHIMTCIRDLEKATGKDRKYFIEEENAFD